MGKNLIIVESPSKAKTIEKFLGSKYVVKASMGHLRDLPAKSLGVDIENNFKAKYVTDRKKNKVVQELKKFAKDAEAVYLASDHDREGEAIAWHLAHILKKEVKDKPLHRIIFNEITKSAISKAVQNPGEIDQNKVDSQQARRILDRIVGYTLSPMLWKVITKNLSAGRVQSVALRIICEREEEIEAFKPEEYWNIEAYLFKDALAPFKSSLSKWNNKKAKISDKATADKILAHIKENDYQLSKIKESSRKIQPGPSYITSTLQQDAARFMGFSAKRTMMVAQQLYEGIELGGDTTGLITYMRTDSLRISSEALDNCRNLIKQRYGDKYLNPKPRVFKKKSSAQDAHEAIRPTDANRTPNSLKPYLSSDQLKLYSLIWEKFVATQMIPATVKSKNLEITAGKALFKASGSTIVEPGFMEAFPHTNVATGELIDREYKESDLLKAKELKSEQKFTKPPARYSEAMLIKELESLGIGRPSTYASITNTIIVRKYVELLKKRFHPTDLGRVVNKFLVANFSEFLNVKFTAEMENNLDEITYGKVNWQDSLKEYYDELVKLMDQVDAKKAKSNLIEETEHKCEKCGSPMAIKWGKNGQFLACTNFPECKNIKDFTKDEAGNIKIVEPEKVEGECPKCGSELLVKNGRFGKFIACSNYPKCKHTQPFTTGIKCPECEDGEITEKKNRKGRYFYSCSNYPDCKYISNDKPVDIKCPACGNHFMQEKYSKEKGKHLLCPNCKKEVF
jgi:DNA topoisomerase-1